MQAFLIDFRPFTVGIHVKRIAVNTISILVIDRLIVTPPCLMTQNQLRQLVFSLFCKKFSYALVL